MTEIPTTHPFSILSKVIPRINYSKIKGYLQLLTVFFIIVASVSLGSKGAIINTIGYALMASIMFNFANKCEAIILKQKIERWLVVNAPSLPLEEE